MYNLKLFKLKNEDYEELKEFFYEKMELINKQTNIDVSIKETILKKEPKKRKSMLNYYGTKRYLINNIKLLR